MNKIIFLLFAAFSVATLTTVSAEACPKLQGKFQCYHYDEIQNVEFQYKSVNGVSIYQLNGQEIVADGQPRKMNLGGTFTAACKDETLALITEQDLPKAKCRDNIETKSISHTALWTLTQGHLVQTDLITLNCVDGSKVSYDFGSYDCAPRE